MRSEKKKNNDQSMHKTPVLRIYKTVQEQQLAEAQANAEQSPIERLRETVELILRVYGVSRGDTTQRKKNMHIQITQYP